MTAIAVSQTHSVTPTVTVSVIRLTMQARSQKIARSTEESAIGSVLLAMDPQHLIVWPVLNTHIATVMESASVT